MSTIEELWRRKPDGDIVRAASAVAEYSDEAQRAIMSEVQRRGLHLDRSPSDAPSARRPTVGTCFLSGWKHVVQFRGRATRWEYFVFVGCNVVIVASLLILGGVTDQRALAFTGLIYLTAVQLPQLSMLVRRLHDTGRSGWWWLTGLIPLVGWIALLALALGSSDPHENKWGAPSDR